MVDMKFARNGIEKLVAYVPGKPVEEVKKEYGLDDIIKLASNENPLGISPKALAAMKAETANCFMYPEGTSLDLRTKLAAKLGVKPEMLIVSNGADHILNMLGMAFINAGDECIMPDPSFAAYTTNAIIMGGIPVKVPVDKNLVVDLEAMAAKITDKTKLIYICNPNNPIANIVTKQQVDAFMAKVPDHVIVVFDEAYYEYVQDPEYPQTVEYVNAGKNVIITRTFSKVFGLAGTRIGYAIAPMHLMDILGRVALPFPVNRVAQAGALAAMDDQEFMDATIKTNNEGRAYLFSEFDKMGMEYCDSQTNFVFVNVHMDAKTTFTELLKTGVIIRPGHLWGYDQYLRVTIGTMPENQKFIAELRKLKEAQK